jgi:hypothetical protein
MLIAFFAILRSFLRLLDSIRIADLDLANDLFAFRQLIRCPVRDLVLPLLERFTIVLGGLEQRAQGWLRCYSVLSREARSTSR